MSRNGMTVAGQLRSNWGHASGKGMEGIRQHCQDLSDRSGLKFNMAGYAMVEPLRAMNVVKVALTAAYHWPACWQGTVGFLKEAGFDVVWPRNFHDQGWFNNQDEVNAKR